MNSGNVPYKGGETDEVCNFKLTAGGKAAGMLYKDEASWTDTGGADATMRADAT